ncbi:MAG: hypothetical protein ACI9IP_001415 [Arcticibacterium sp.]|jgi:hypothetical protein
MKDFKNISDQAFDELFKESAENTLPDFDESAWGKMEALLDDPAPDKGGFALKKPLIYSAIIALLLSIGYFTYDGLLNKNGEVVSTKGLKVKLEEANVSSKLENESIISGAQTPASGEIVNEVPINKLSIGRPELSKSLKKRKDLNSGNTIIGVKEKGVPITINSNTMAFNSKNSAAKNAQAFQAESSRILENRPLLAKEIGQGLDNQKLNIEQGGERIENSSSVPSNSSISATNGITTRDVSIDQHVFPKMETRAGVVSAVALKVNIALAELVGFGFKNYKISFSVPHFIVVALQEETVEQESRLSLRLAISPDFSSVPENAFFKIGHNWAALLEYRINNRWSLQTGLIKSLKYYTAGPSQYRWPVAWGEKPAELDHIDARCNMLDIPINIRYDFTQGRNRWFAQAGLTSYLMLNEQYDYVYSAESPAQKWYKWEGKTGFYAAGVSNLSFGLEKRLSKRLTFQAEPFAKIPIGKVGYGNVKLATVGVFLSTKIALIK